MDLILAIVGLVLLVFAGDFLVCGAVALSLKLGISALVVSLTVVAFGTSAPELLIGVRAALEDADGIVFGNVVGSNIANVLLVMGLPAVLATIRTQECETRRSFITMIGATLLFIALCFMGPLQWWHGAIMLAALLAILLDTYRSARRSSADTGDGFMDELEDADPEMPGWKLVLFLALGLAGLPLGANLLIEGAQGIALKLGVSEAVIGLTLVAIGTSMPELATTVMATLRGKADVVLGNVIGSNLFNLLAIMGITAFFGPLDVPGEFLSWDLWIMLFTSLLLIPFVLHWTNLNRWWGIGFVAIYAGYIAHLV